jgi:hypothetical protein
MFWEHSLRCLEEMNGHGRYLELSEYGGGGWRSFIVVPGKGHEKELEISSGDNLGKAENQTLRSWMILVRKLW